jgi:hypothetical protein
VSTVQLWLSAATIKQLSGVAVNRSTLTNRSAWRRDPESCGRSRGWGFGKGGGGRGSARCKKETQDEEMMPREKKRHLERMPREKRRLEGWKPPREGMGTNDP